jgi:glucan 1,3-beta-glucosidase
MRYLGKDAGSALFKQHRDSFITESDFIAMSQAGLNTVRIPVGYWIRPVSTGPATVFAPGAVAYLDSAMVWAANHNLKILVDIHGAMGSQNGDTNSACETTGTTNWVVTPGTIDDTLALVRFLVSRYKAKPAFLGLSLLNEPGQLVNLTTLKQYYLQAYNLVRSTLDSNCLLTVAPRINEQYPSATGDWRQFMIGTAYTNVVMEWHRYQIWGFESLSYTQITDFVNNVLAQDMKEWTGLPLLIGEWTATMAGVPLTDDEYHTYVQAQLAAFAPTRGQFFWTWKFYGDADWWSNSWSYKNSSLKKFF